jgi:molybdopterin synthase sulfur carrier subunit
VVQVEAGNRDVTVRFFASIREIFGQKEAVLSTDEAATVGEVLRHLCSTPERKRGVFAEAGAVRSDVIVLLNGRNIVFLGGLHAPLQSGDVVSVFPPVKGG